MGRTRWNHRTAQSTLEYAVLAAVVVGALLAMQIYVKRGAMGKMKDATDQVGEQFAPMKFTATYTDSFDSSRHDNTSFDGFRNSELIDQVEQQQRTGVEAVTEKLDAETLY